MKDAELALTELLASLESDRELFASAELCRRLEALDRLDAFAPHDSDGSADGALPILAFQLRAAQLRARLESANLDLYRDLRQQIQQGKGARALGAWLHPRLPQVRGGSTSTADGFDFDYLDELVSGVLQLDEPDEQAVQRRPEMVFYQPTPARHIFRMIELSGLAAGDTLVDLGSGLGHVSLLAAICTGVESHGIELESAYVATAQRCAESLNLKRVRFIQQDARAADLSRGTVFYLHTPFSGSILRDVLAGLEHEAKTRSIRVCTFGPCTPVVAEQRWLKADGDLRTDRIALFRSQG